MNAEAGVSLCISPELPLCVHGGHCRFLDKCTVGQTIEIDLLQGDGKRTVSVTLQDAGPPPGLVNPIRFGPTPEGSEQGEEYEFMLPPGFQGVPPLPPY
jgi:hypothetical protein